MILWLCHALQWWGLVSQAVCLPWGRSWFQRKQELALKVTVFHHLLPCCLFLPTLFFFSLIELPKPVPPVHWGAAAPAEQAAGGQCRRGGAGPHAAPRRPLQWGVCSTRGSSRFWVAELKPSQHLQAKSCGWQTLCVRGGYTQGGLLSSWEAEEMLVPEPTLPLGKVKHFQACCVSAQGVQGFCHPSWLLGQPRHPAHSRLSLALEPPCPKHCWMKVCSVGPCGKGQFPTAEQTHKADRTTEQF